MNVTDSIPETANDNYENLMYLLEQYICLLYIPVSKHSPQGYGGHYSESLSISGR